MKNLLPIIAKYDLVIDNYEVRLQTGLTQVVGLFIDDRQIITDVIINGKCITGEKVLLYLIALTEGDFSKVSIVSKHEQARRKRSDRRKEKDFCPAFFQILNMINDVEEEDESPRYDNKVNADILPDYRLSLADVFADELSLIDGLERYEIDQEPEEITDFDPVWNDKKVIYIGA